MPTTNTTYKRPKVKIVVVAPMQVICQSTGFTSYQNSDSWDTQSIDDFDE